jgi:creatinine amidohydrolase/Fe(II)-dependent formamide hydrolase-like protein
LVQEALEKKDFHSGELETSLMLYWRPEEVRDKAKWVTDKQELMDLFAIDQDAYQVRIKPMESQLVCPVVIQNPEIEVGVMCPPEYLRRARAELGRRLVEDCIQTLVELIGELESATYGD